jgi:hypothetical protein
MSKTSGVFCVLKLELIFHAQTHAVFSSKDKYLQPTVQSQASHRNRLARRNADGSVDHRIAGSPLPWETGESQHAGSSLPSFDWAMHRWLTPAAHPDEIPNRGCLVPRLDNALQTVESRVADERVPVKSALKVHSRAIAFWNALYSFAQSLWLRCKA